MWEGERQELTEKGTVVVAVSVIAGRPRTRVRGCMADGTVKLDIGAPSERGAANSELIRYLADAFRLPPAHVRIVRGKLARHKQVRITL